MNFAFIPFKRLVVFVLSIAGLIFILSQAGHTLSETHPYDAHVRRAGSEAAAKCYWLALRGGRLLTRQAVYREIKSGYQIYVPFVPVAAAAKAGMQPDDTDAKVRVIALFEGDTRDDAIKNARDAIAHANGGEVTITGTRVPLVDPREFFPTLAMTDDCFVLGNGRTPWPWWNVALGLVVCVGGIVFGGWPLITAAFEARRDAEEWKEATAPPTRNLPDIRIPGATS
jgi:hypothetical protein